MLIGAGVFSTLPIVASCPVPRCTALVRGKGVMHQVREPPCLASQNNDTVARSRRVPVLMKTRSVSQVRKHDPSAQRDRQGACGKEHHQQKSLETTSGYLSFDVSVMVIA